MTDTIESLKAEIAKLTQERDDDRAAVKIFRRNAEAAESALARLTTPGEGAREIARDIVESHILDPMPYKFDNLEKMIATALTTYATTRIAARERAERRAGKMREVARQKMREVLRQLIEGLDKGSVQLASEFIGGNYSEGVPQHPWHEEWLHYARAALDADGEG